MFTFQRNRSSSDIARRRKAAVRLESLEERQLLTASKTTVAPVHALAAVKAVPAQVHVQATETAATARQARAAAAAAQRAEAAARHAAAVAEAKALKAAKTVKTPTAATAQAKPTPRIISTSFGKIVKPRAVGSGGTIGGTIDPYTLTFAGDTFRGNVSDATSFHVDPSDSTISTLTGIKYTWNFGDGSAPYIVVMNGVNDLSVYHKYGSTGTFNVSVSATYRGRSISNVATTQAVVGVKPIPGLAQWQSNMITYGKTAAAAIADPNAGSTVDGVLGAVYYDAERVFYQIAAYTNDPTWLVAAQNAQTIYRDRYVIPNNGMIPGYWNFAQGLLMNYKLTGDPVSKQAILMLASNAAYASDATPVEWTAPADHSREVAYNILTMLAAEEVGAPHRARLDLLVNQALGHINQWFVSKTATFIQPFMVGLTCDALIQWYNKTGDSRVLPAVKTAMDGIWANLWDVKTQSFLYLDRVVAGEGGPTPAPDLNMLIAPSFAWLYHMTGDVKYRDSGDQVFQGGTQSAYLSLNKQFNQNYRNSFDYVALRSASPLVNRVSSGSIDLVAPSSISGTEGIAVSVPFGSFVDTGQKLGTWTVTADWGDGSTPSSFTVAAQGTLPSFSHFYVGQGDYPITIRVANSAGGFDEFVQHALIQDAPPVVSALSPLVSTVSVLTPAVFTIGVFDEHSADRLQGYDITWYFGDGSVPVTVHGAEQICHIYNLPGTFTVSVRAAKATGLTSNLLNFTVNSVLPPAIKPIPNLALWQQRMLTLGQQYAASLTPTSSFTVSDFDFMQVLYQIYSYTDMVPWAGTAIRNAEIAYRDNYVLPNKGSVQASASFATGLATDFLRTGDITSRDAVVQLIDKTQYTGVNSNIALLADAGSHAQDVAFALMNQIAAADVGYSQINWMRQLVNTALGYLDQWFVTKTVPISSFNVSLVCNALYRYADRTGDPRVLPAIQNAMDSLWAQTWNSTAQAFNGTTTGTPAPNTQINMMAASIYAWLYDKTGNTTYRDEADSAFAGGVQNPSIYSERTFAMNYLFSFDYVYRRSRAPLTPSV